MTIYRHTHPGAALLDAIGAMSGTKACNAVYAALADKKDVTPEDLEILSNLIGRLAWDRARSAIKKDLP